MISPYKFRCGYARLSPGAYLWYHTSDSDANFHYVSFVVESFCRGTRFRCSWGTGGNWSTLMSGLPVHV